MKIKLFDYVEKDNYIYNLSGLTKLICFLFLTFSAMLSYDTRCVIFLMLFSIFLFRASEIPFSKVKLMIIYVGVFLLINMVFTFLFSPLHGVEIYGTRHDIFAFSERYVLTQEQLLYQVTKAIKYAVIVPVSLMFVLTTNPSEFAASLNRAGCSYKGAYAVSLTLRYFPDLIREFQDISLAQQSRGLDLSKKEKLGTRIKNVINICVPLIFTTLDRIELVSNAMELRSFGKHKKRTWYTAKKLNRSDYTALITCGLIFAAVMAVSLFVNHSRFYNPFI